MCKGTFTSNKSKLIEELQGKIYKIVEFEFKCDSCGNIQKLEGTTISKRTVQNIESREKLHVSTECTNCNSHIKIIEGFATE